MADARIEHTLRCSDDTFWKVFLDPEFNQELYLKELGFESWKVVSMDDKGDRIERVVDVVPKLGDLPGPLKKLAEGGAGYRERNSFDKKAKRMSVGVEPSTLQGKLTISGVVYTQPIDDKTCKRIAEMTVVAKVFGIGGMIESRILADIKASYDKAAVFTGAYAQKKGY